MIPTSSIQLVAHRGHAREFPENTLPAFSSALELGLRFLELDVQLSLDGVPMVIHDARLDRTTHRRGSVFDLPAAELATIDAGEPRRFGARFRGTLLPALSDVLALLRGRPELTLFVEIKRESLQHFGHEHVLARVIDALGESDTRCVVISFDLAAIVQARECAGVPIGWVLPEYDAHSRLKYEALQPEFLFCDHRRLPQDGLLWRGPWQWAVYEVDSPSLALALAGRGVSLIETMAAREMSAALHG